MNLSIDLLASMPPESVGPALLAEPEGQWYDRKSARISARDLARALVAMANAEGGLIAIGLHRGVCQGVDAAVERQNDWRQAGLDFTDPPVRFDARLVECLNADDRPDHVFLIEVAPGQQVYATSADEAYVRSGDENRKLSFDQRIDLRYDRGDTTFESRPQPSLDGSALDAGAVKAYAQRLGHDPDQLLHARDLLSADGSPTTAGLLLFGRRPQQVFPHARVRVLRCAGTEWRTGSNQNLVYDRTFEGTLPQQIDAACRP